MLKTVALLTSQVIYKEDLSTFLRLFDATPDSDKIYEGVVESGKDYVWVGISSEGLQYEAEQFQVIKQKLGDQPRTSIVFDIGKSLGSEQLAVQLACEFAIRWPCVIDDVDSDDLEDNNRRFLSSAELFALREKGRGFHDFIE